MIFDGRGQKSVYNYVEGLGFRVYVIFDGRGQNSVNNYVLRSRGQGVGFRVEGPGFRVSDLILGQRGDLCESRL